MLPVAESQAYSISCTVLENYSLMVVKIKPGTCRACFTLHMYTRVNYFKYILTNKIIIPVKRTNAKIIIAIPHILNQCVLESLNRVLYNFVPFSYLANDINLETVLTVLNVKL